MEHLVITRPRDNLLGPLSDRSGRKSPPDPNMHEEYPTHAAIPTMFCPIPRMIPTAQSTRFCTKQVEFFEMRQKTSQQTPPLSPDTITANHGRNNKRRKKRLPRRQDSQRQSRAISLSPAHRTNIREIRPRIAGMVNKIPSIPVKGPGVIINAMAVTKMAPSPSR